MSMVSWFHVLRGVNSFVHVFIGFFGVKGFIVSSVSWFHRFRSVNSFMVS